MSNENQSSKVPIIIAIITLIGTLGTGLLANWDKVFPSSDITDTTNEGGSKPSLETTSLEKFLENKNWIEADQATNLLQPQSLSCDELSSINKLWLNYSDGNFGYSLQRKIWEQKKVKENYIDFAEIVGWKVNDDYAFNIYHDILITDPDAQTKAPLGHLPFHGWQVNGLARKEFGDFMDRLAQCKI